MAKKRKICLALFIAFFVIFSVIAIFLYNKKESRITVKALMDSINEYEESNNANIKMTVGIKAEISSEWLGDNIFYFVPESLVAPDMINMDFENIVSVKSDEKTISLNESINYNSCEFNNYSDKCLTYIDMDNNIMYESFDEGIQWYKTEYEETAGVRILSDIIGMSDTFTAVSEDGGYVLKGNAAFKDIVNMYTDKFDSIIPEMSLPVEICFDKDLNPYKLQIASSEKTDNYAVDVDFTMDISRMDDDVTMPDGIRESAKTYEYTKEGENEK